MSCGATYLANDRVFVSVGSGGVTAVAFPLSVAIGMGSLLQFPRLAEVVDDPLLATYPRMRWDLDKLRKLPRGQWSAQGDKVEFIPAELATLLSAPAPAASGCVKAIVVPAVSKTPCSPRCTPIPKARAKELLERNRFRQASNATYPDARDEQLLGLAAYELVFNVSAENPNLGKSAFALLQDAIQCAS